MIITTEEKQQDRNEGKTHRYINIFRKLTNKK